MRLHGFVRGSATWRVRIALALKNLAVDTVEHAPTEEARGAELPPFLTKPLFPGSLPTMETDAGAPISQSIAIVEWLEEMWPTPPLLPPDPLGRARVRAFAMTIACDLQPLHSARVMRRLHAVGLTAAQARHWLRLSLSDGLDACEALLNSADGPFCFGAMPGLADLCLVPQLALARQLGATVTYPRLLAAEAACLTLPAFSDTRPPPDELLET
jgi:maleylpyruvate isomerase